MADGEVLILEERRDMLRKDVDFDKCFPPEAPLNNMLTCRGSFKSIMIVLFFINRITLRFLPTKGRTCIETPIRFENIP